MVAFKYSLIQGKCFFFDSTVRVRVDGEITLPTSDSEPDVLVAGKRAYVAVSPSPKNRT